MEISIEVRYAGVVVGRGALVRDLGEEGAFVGIAEPMPVGTAVTLKIGDAVREGRVDEVVESSDPATVGMRVRWGGVARSAPAPTAVPVVAAAVVTTPEAPSASAAAVTTPEAPSASAAVATPEAAVAPAAAAESGVGASPVAETDDASGAIPAPMTLGGAGGDRSHQRGGKRPPHRR